MNFETISLSIEDGVALLALNRPDRLNSFNADMHEEVRQAMKAIKKDESVRCLVLTGNGRGFCAGQDLSDRNVAADVEMPDLGVSVEKNYNPLVRTLRDLPMPVICAVNGVAAGAGANLALVCDIVVAARSASFVQGFSKIGLVPDSGGTWTMPRLVGTARAKALMLLSEKVTAEQAEEWGMIWKCVDDEALMDEVMVMARKLAKQPTKGFDFTLRAVNAANTNTLDEQLDLERDLQRMAGRTDDYREGVAAFMEKRAPEFKGK